MGERFVWFILGEERNERDMKKKHRRAYRE